MSVSHLPGQLLRKSTEFFPAGAFSRLVRGRACRGKGSSASAVLRLLFRQVLPVTAIGLFFGLFCGLLFVLKDTASLGGGIFIL